MSAEPSPAPPAELVLTGESTPVRVLLGDLRSRLDLLPMLARHDFRARYRSAGLGLAWSVLLPLLQGAVLAVVFTRFVRIETDIAYPVFVIAGITVWSYISQSLTAASSAIVDTSGLASRVYFPRMILPAVAPTANAVGLVISLGVVLLLMPFFGVLPGLPLLVLPLAVALTALLVVALAGCCALAHVYFRDVKYLVSAATLVLFYATPVIYPPSLAGDLAPLLAANPFTGVVQLTRWSLFGQADHVGPAVASTMAWLVVLLAVMVRGFSRHERTAVDRL